MIPFRDLVFHMTGLRHLFPNYKRKPPLFQWQFYKGNLRDGDELESEASIVVIGDVEKGAKVSAKGNIVVLGALRGAAYAGVCGNENAVIVAFEMAPMSVRIAGLSLKKAGNGRHLGRGPMMILSENGKVVEEPIKKSFLSALNFI